MPMYKSILSTDLRKSTHSVFNIFGLSCVTIALANSKYSEGVSIDLKLTLGRFLQFKMFNCMSYIINGDLLV